MDTRVLAADVGGTKTNLALYRADDRARDPEATATLASGDFGSFDGLARSFLDSHGGPPLGRVTIGVAGPVTGNRARVTNLPWRLDGDELARSLGADDVTLLNDLAAVAHALPTLGPDQLETVHEGTAGDGGTAAVVGAGTGLGMATVVRRDGQATVVASEGGHASFSPIDDEQAELLAFVRRDHDHVSFERVCSGSLGVPNLYRFLRDTGRHPEPSWLAEELDRADDRTPVIFAAAEEGRSALCDATVELFVAVLGVAAGNLALTVLATGGVYLGGGVPPRIVDRIRGPAFARGFTTKGRFSDLLQKIPVQVITDPRAGLWGAAAHALAG